MGLKAIFLFSLFVSHVAFAQSPRKERHLVKSATQRNFLFDPQFEVGINHSYHRYEEPNFMKIKGNQWGLNLVYNWYNYDQTIRVRPEIEYLSGTFNYYGATCDAMGNCQPATAPGKESYRTLRVTVGSLQHVNKNLLLTPYAGLAQRYLDNKIGGPSSYRREITYFYAPLGIELAKAITPGAFRLRALLEYDVFLSGVVKTHLTDVPGFLTDLTNHQSKGYGIRTSVSFDWKVSSTWLSIQPYLQYWNVKDSDLAVGDSNSGPFEGMEPKNNTRTGGLIFSVLL